MKTKNKIISLLLALSVVILLFAGEIIIFQKDALQVFATDTSETWVFKDLVDGTGDEEYSINFTSNNNSYIGIKFGYGCIKYKISDSQEYTVYDGINGGWVIQDMFEMEPDIDNTAYKTITFSTAPTGNLLIYLQSNATKQGGGDSGNQQGGGDASTGIETNLAVGLSITLAYVALVITFVVIDKKKKLSKRK